MAKNLFDFFDFAVKDSYVYDVAPGAALPPLRYSPLMNSRKNSLGSIAFICEFTKSPVFLVIIYSAPTAFALSTCKQSSML
ncbi:hypothetical protein AGMMS50267_11340 [Spirochaetia bacterium]|nr:hypothetical protein AGMMS50267_11340 [Spirochaetia bacterium]